MKRIVIVFLFNKSGLQDNKLHRNNYVEMHILIIAHANVLSEVRDEMWQKLD